MNNNDEFKDEVRDLDHNDLPREVAKLLSHIAKLDPKQMEFAILGFGHRSTTDEDTLEVVQMAAGDPKHTLRAMHEMTERILKSNPDMIMSFVLNTIKLVQQLRPDNVAIVQANARTPEGARILREHGLDQFVETDERSPEEIVAEVLRGIANGTITKH